MYNCLLDQELEMRKTFSRHLVRKYRLEEKMTLQKAAELAGIEWQNWQRWELGTVKPSADALHTIALVLHCDMEDLFDYPV